VPTILNVIQACRVICLVSQIRRVLGKGIRKYNAMMPFL